MQKQQHRIALRGSEESISHFTHLLVDLKEATGHSSAELLTDVMASFRRGHATSSSLSSTAASRVGASSARVFHLHLLSSPELQTQIGEDMVGLRLASDVKLALAAQGVARTEFLLEALILLLELYQSQVRSESISRLSDSPRIGTDNHVVEDNKPKAVGFRSTSNHIPDVSSNNGIRNRAVENGNCGRESECGLTAPGRLQELRRQLRQQQLAESKSISDRINRRSRKEFAIHSVSSSVVEERPILSRQDLSQLGKVSTCWVPVHNEAIRKSSLINGGLAENGHGPDNEATDASTNQTRFDLECSDVTPLSLKQRRDAVQRLSAYLETMPAEAREVPGFDGRVLTAADRVREGVDCDEVAPGVFVGSGATVKRKDYLRNIGVTHVLNAAEFRGVNVAEEYFAKPGDRFKYLGLKIEDTPQTQICRHFVEVSNFIDSAVTGGGRVFVNCVFGKSRSATCVVAYLMLRRDFSALSALTRIRQRRPIVINSGFMQQIADLEHKLQSIAATRK